MEAGKLRVNYISEVDERSEHICASQALEAPAATAKPAAKRQLKDYPQSLQTAARALWG